MSKQNLIDNIAHNCSTSKAEAARIVEAFVAGVEDELANGRNVTLVGFGSFTLQHKEARMARNPRTGEQIAIDAKNTVKFKPGRDLLKAVQ